MKLPKAVFLAATVLFVLSLLGTIISLGVFFWYDTGFWYSFDVDEVLEVATVLLSGLTVSSGVLFYHFRHGEESYMTFEAIVFFICFALSLCNLLWILPATIFA